jgi:hypothetical protein
VTFSFWIINDFIRFSGCRKQSGVLTNGNALACYERALAINPRFAEAWFNAGAELINFQRYREALTYIENGAAVGCSTGGAGNGVLSAKLGS